MKTLTIAFIIGIIALLVLTGCNTDAQKSYPPQGDRYVGGGCGVSAPVSDAGTAAEAVASAPAQTLAA